MGAPDSFVGRAAELAALRDQLERALTGQGGACLVRGEAGAGKSRLLEELREAARGFDLEVAVGRCWEAGGAPAYWPWIQVLRGLARRGWVLDPSLSPLLPELGQRELGQRDERASLEPAAARFTLLDAVVRTLADGAQGRPLLVLLEDLHAADASSLQVLELLATAAETAPLLVIGSYREADSRRGAAGPHLDRVARQAKALSLGRLTVEDVEAYLAAHGAAALAPRLHEVSDGNALFMVETARYWLGRAASLELTSAPAPTLAGVIEERLARLPTATREALAAASVYGRSFTFAQLAAVHPAAERAGLAAACDGELLLGPSGDRYRFGHILLREALLRGLDPGRRAALHDAAALHLESVPPVRWSAVAFHRRQAGAAPELFARSAERAAEDALTGHAFEEAAHWLDDALEALPADSPERGPLLHRLGRARILYGDADGGRAACLEAAQLAERAGDAEAYAQAALTYGTVFVFGEVDQELVSLLEGALARLPESEVALRARVLGRLAGALQPAADPDVPIAMARDAVALARQTGDPSTLLATLRSATSAMMDLGDPEERARANGEALRLARDLHEPVEAWRGSLRLTFDHLEQGAFGEARFALEVTGDVAERLALPHYRWPERLARAMLALHRGGVEEAEALRAEAKALAERAGDDEPASRPLVLQAMQHARYRGDHDRARALLPKARAALSTLRFGEVLVPLLEGALGVAAESDAERVLRACDRALALRDLSLLELVVEIPLATGDPERAAALEAALRPRAQRLASWGQLGMTVGPPGAYLLARLAMARGQPAAAVDWLDAAQRTVRRTGSSPLGAMVEAASRQIEMTRRASAAEDSAVETRAAETPTAETSAAETPAAETPAAETPTAETSAAETSATPIRLAREGEGWALSAKGRVLRLGDTRGVQLLARLVAERGRALHVLELVSPTGRAEDVDRGDAGEAIDAQARDAYRTRVRALRAELAEAEGWNDAGRAERTRAELEAIEAELSRALGLGGRPRRDKGAAERARVNVQRRLRDALDRIGKQDGEVAKELRGRLKTGMHCVFE